MKSVKILIAVPCMEHVPVPFVDALLHMDRPENTSIMFKQNSLVYDSRNLLSLVAIENEYDYVLWIDSDMIVPQDTLVRLLNDITASGSDIVSGLYVKRSVPTAPVIYSELREPEVNACGVKKRITEYIHYPDDALFEVEGCGFGCVLTSVNLLRAVWDKFGPAFAPFIWAGEDLSFCWRARNLGFRIMCDSSVHCGHVGSFVYSDRLLGGDAGEKC